MAARRCIERARKHVADHRAVARDAYVQLRVGPAFDLDRLAHHREGPRAVRCDVAALVVELLEIQVLHVRTGVRCTPGDAVVPADDHTRHAGQRGTDRVDSRRMQMGEVPDVWCGQPEVRVVGHHRLAAGATRTGNHPAVGRAAGTGISARDLRRLLFQRAVKLAQIRQLRQRFARIGRKQLLDA